MAGQKCAGSHALLALELHLDETEGAVAGRDVDAGAAAASTLPGDP